MNIIEKNSLSLYKVLYNGNMKDIIFEAEKYFKMPFILYDTSFQIIASSSKVNDIHHGLESNKNITYIRSAEIERMKNNKILEKMYESNGAFPIHDDCHDVRWLFSPIKIHSSLLGFIAIFFLHEIPTETDIEMSNILAQVISVEMQKHNPYTSKTGLKYEYFLTSLLDEQFKFENSSVIEARLKALDCKLYKYLFIACISYKEASNNSFFNKNLIEYSRKIFPNSMSVIYNDIIVLLVMENSEIKFSDEYMHQLIDFLGTYNLKASISQPFMNILDAPLYYKQSAKTMKIGLTLNPNKLYYFSSDYLLFHLFDSYEKTDLQNLIHYHIKYLLDYDNKYNTDYIKTIKVYLENNRNAGKTSSALNLHRTTLFYRIKKIEDLLNISFEDNDVLFLFEISLKILEYLSKVNSI
ncbi:hypothetical protein HBE96_03075 [Clostridium sp. P21]|uniref:PucR C-terminal helix-turn-helix domain-containing protein n=1 Tax=Clostridium muellerianum TaxID=2716538 RepID=A0A7Y0EDW6_9CLOT|nr:helix-turn-helix domain-containing protein [Clostridium muellerianum]NMM61689.1 hypothetical protein [Clostridium muellerianum]